MNMNNIQTIVDKDGIVFLNYGGFLSQTLITAMTEALEMEAKSSNINMGDSSNIFIIFIELSQNMMNYSKSMKTNDASVIPQGLILVSKDKEHNYHIHSQNVVTNIDKQKIERKLKEIHSLDRNAIKRRYRELRKSGEQSHEKGAGIGFYEIAKRCDSLDYEFKEINKNRYYFHLKTNIITKKGNH